VAVKIKKRKREITHLSNRERKSMVANLNARNPYGPPGVTLTGLLTPIGEADVKISIGQPQPVLMFPNREAFRADVAILSTPRGTSFEYLGWIDRARFDEFIRQHHLDPGGVIKVGAEYLRSMEERSL
jgi:hypothetical protein